MNNKIILIDIDSTAIVEIPPDKLNDWFNYLKERFFGGGLAETIYPFGMDYPVLIDEEGKFKDYGLNLLASALMDGRLRPGDWIAGPALVTRFNGSDDIDPLSDADIEAVRGLISARMA